MPVLLDSYSEANHSYQEAMIDGTVDGYGGHFQGFNGNGGTLDSCKFYLRKVGSPTGNIVAKLYAITGFHGINATPTGAALATSGNIAASSVSTSFGLVTFTFSGADRVVMANGTSYCIAVEYTSGSVSNNIEAGMDITSPTHAGNGGYYYVPDGGWVSSGSARDVIFYVYNADPSVRNKRIVGMTQAVHRAASW